MTSGGNASTIVYKINAWFKEINAGEDTKKFLALSGADPLTRSPDEAQEMFQKALVEWGDYVLVLKRQGTDIANTFNAR